MLDGELPEFLLVPPNIRHKIQQLQERSKGKCLNRCYYGGTKFLVDSTSICVIDVFPLVVC